MLVDDESAYCMSLGKKPHEFPSDSTLACRMATIHICDLSHVFCTAAKLPRKTPLRTRCCGSTKRANRGTERWAVPRPLRMIIQTPGHWRAQQAHCTVVDSEWVETRHTPHKPDQTLFKDQVWGFGRNSSRWTKAEQVQNFKQKTNI